MKKLDDRSAFAGMNQRQIAFVSQFVGGSDGIRGNATAAYRAAGYVARGNAAEAGASKLLRNPKVDAAIRALRAQALDAITESLRDWMELAPMAQGQLKAIAEGKLLGRYAETVRRAACDILDRALGKPQSRVQLSGSATIDALLADTDDDVPARAAEGA